MLKFGLPTFVFVIINILVLYWFMNKFLFKRVTEHMDKRAKLIKDSIDNAEKDKAEASDLKQKYEDMLKSAREEAGSIVSQAHSRADREYGEIISTARQDAEGILSKAIEEIENERAQMLREIKNQVAGLALAAASKVIEANMDTEANRTLVDKFIDEAGAA